MTLISVKCRSCGSTDKLYDSEVVVYSAHYALGMRYRCPNCDTIQTRDISLNIFGLLSNAGCQYEYYARPAECNEWHADTPWSDSEILDFILDTHGDVSIAVERELNA